MVISEEHEVIALPACGGHDKTVTFEKPDGCTDFLAFRIIQRRKLIHIDTELCQITPFQPQRLISGDLDTMHDNGLRGQRRKLAPMEADLGQRTFAFQTGIEHRSLVSGAPPPATR